MKKRLSILLSVFVLSMGVGVVQPIKSVTAADSVPAISGDITENLVEDPLLRGKKPPTGSSYLNLADNTYKYNVDFKYNVYTNSLFSGVTTIKVKVGVIDVNKNGMKNESKGITVHLYNADKKFIKKKSISLDRGTATFKKLKKSTKYYVRFTKEDDTQIYKFKGKIYN